jgi:hypothetical protein
MVRLFVLDPDLSLIWGALPGSHASRWSNRYRCRNRNRPTILAKLHLASDYDYDYDNDNDNDKGKGKNRVMLPLICPAAGS